MMSYKSMTKSRSFPRYLYAVTLFMLILTGFAQMPIFKRYYIADLPGLGWLGEFYVTHLLHYLFAALFIGYAAFKVSDRLLSGKGFRFSKSMGYFRLAVFGGLVLTGALLVVRNLAGVNFPPSFIIFIDLAHLAFVMGLIGNLLIRLLTRRV